MMPRVPDRRAPTDAEIEAAVRVLTEPGRLDEAQRVVGTAAPALQNLIDEALVGAEWFGSAHRSKVREAAEAEDLAERLDAVQGIVAEETRLAMLIGVAVGYELAHVLKGTEGGN